MRAGNLTFKVKFLYKNFLKFDLFCQILAAQLLPNAAPLLADKRSSFHTHRRSSIAAPSCSCRPDAAPYDAAPYGVKI